MSKEGLSEEVTCELRDVKGASHKDLRQEWSQTKEVTAETLKWKTGWCVQMPEARPVWQECTPEVSEARAAGKGQFT